MNRGVLAAALLLAAAGAAAQDTQRELIYGAEMMTRSEREDYRYRVQRATTEDEGKKVRERHRDQMQRRARARGATLGEDGVLEKKK